MACNFASPVRTLSTSARRCLSSFATSLMRLARSARVVLAQGVRFCFEQIRGPDGLMQKRPVLDGREWQDMPPLRAANRAA
jgi:hypothetical protein